tara:strand:- start:113 stop:226 length:114 start_codon:yes stop_codon:yes gene_type:complete
MGYGIGSEDPEELVYYNKIKEELRKSTYRNMGIKRTD